MWRSIPDGLSRWGVIPRGSDYQWVSRLFLRLLAIVLYLFLFDDRAVRWVTWFVPVRYHFTTPKARAESGNWWKREYLGPFL